MNTVNKDNYDPKSARYDLAEKLLNLLTPCYEAIDNARANEMSFASNETVDPADFDNLKNKMSEIVKAAWKMKQANNEIPYYPVDVFYSSLRRNYRGEFIKATKGKSLTFGYRVDIVMTNKRWRIHQRHLSDFAKAKGYEIVNLNEDNMVIIAGRDYDHCVTFSFRAIKLQ